MAVKRVLHRKISMSIKLTPEGKELLRALSEKTGSSMSSLLELLIRERARVEGIEGVRVWYDLYPVEEKEL